MHLLKRRSSNWLLLLSFSFLLFCVAGGQTIVKADVDIVDITDSFKADPQMAEDTTSTMKSQQQGNPIFELPFTKVTAGALTESVDDRWAIAQDTTLTFTIAKGAYAYPFRNVFFGTAYGDLAQLGFVISVGDGYFLDTSNTAGNGISIKVGGQEVPRAATGFIDVGTSSRAETGIYRSNNQIVLTGDLTISIDLSKAKKNLGSTASNKPLGDVDAMQVKEQFPIADHLEQYYKVQLGQLNFKIDLEPTLSPALVFANPITVNGNKIGALVYGKGTIAGDGLRYTTDGTPATAKSTQMTNADGSPVTITKSGQWLWFVPADVALANKKLSVIEVSPQNFDSSTANGDIQDNGKYIDTDDEAQLKELIPDAIANPDKIDDVINQLTKITTDVERKKNAEKLGVALKVDNDADFVFAPHYPGQEAISAVVPPPATTSTSRKMQVVDQDGQALSADWSVDAGKVATTDGGKTATFSVASVTDAMLDQPVTITATGTKNGQAFTITQKINVLALKPEHADKGKPQADYSLNLTQTPADLDAGASQVVFYKRTSLVGPAVTTIPERDLSHRISPFNYLSNEDVYQATFAYHGQNYVTNPVKVIVTAPQGPTVMQAPDLSFTTDGNKQQPTLDGIIRGDYQGDNKLKTPTIAANKLTPADLFAIGSHTGTAANWQVTATMTPFVHDGDHKTLAGDNFDGTGAATSTAQMAVKFGVMNIADLADAFGVKDPDDYNQELLANIEADNQPHQVFAGKGTSDFTLYGTLSAKLSLAKAPAARVGRIHQQSLGRQGIH